MPPPDVDTSLAKKIVARWARCQMYSGSLGHISLSAQPHIEGSRDAVAML